MDVKKGFLWLSLAVLIISCKESEKPEQAHKYTNALIEETSPYLLQHAHNPVNWRAWSPEALEEARAEDKLVLVSIGYSSCHWCHVMEEETFEDENIAALMNENFINIKVDREERPDVDQVYMTALQLIKGSGGWPLNVITLPDGKPLYGGTYHTNAQWKKVITEISKMYREDPIRAREYAERVAAGVQEVNLIQFDENRAELKKELLEEGLAKWRPVWDKEWGGNQGRQKFALPSNQNFLLDYGILADNPEVMEHVEKTLDKIALGGIYDHIGGGFFRYSTDPYWKVPHFEKMLYDNAQLLGLYARAFRQFKRAEYKELVYETFEFIEREMKNPGGGYYSAIDADSEGEEGKFYIWTEEELQKVLGSDFDLFAEYFAIQPGKAWEDGNYVLHKLEIDFDFAAKHSLNIKEFKTRVQSWKEELLQARQERIRPGLDDKIITSWNALLIQALSEAYKSFGDEKFLTAAESSFQFLIEKSFDGEYLIHSYKENSRKIDGFLDDYTYFTAAAISLYEITTKPEYLDWAQKLNDIVNREFRDDNSPLYRYKRNSDLISKIVKINDGVMPSPNATLFRNQLKLGHILYDTTALRSVESAVELVIPAFVEDGSNYTEWGSLLLNKTFAYYEIAVVGSEALSVAAELQTKFLPNALVVASTGPSDLPLFKDRYFEDETYIFVCQNNSCKLPTTSVEDALGQLDRP
ncbi:MAG: thioredoxin domain-containing protein [Flavobacteriaceae bacterium]